VVWLFNRGSKSSRDRGRPRLGSAEREAQLRLGQNGERQVGQLLARDLPPEFVLINGLKLPRGAGDIDHLVVGPTGAFLLETKTMAGRIVCEPDGTWKRTRVGRAGTQYSAYIGDPATQVQRNIFAVRDCLRRQLPGLSRRTSLWIEGMVVFPHPRTELAAEGSRVPAVHLAEAAQRMCSHVPARELRPAEIEQVVEALLSEGQEQGLFVMRTRQSAQALVEAALALPVVLALLCGTVALSRLIQAHTAIVAVAHETARAGGLARSPDDAVRQIRARAIAVAPGLGLDPRDVTVDWDLSSFDVDPGQVLTSVRYPVDLRDLPLAALAPRVVLRAEHVEWIDPFRGGMGPLPLESGVAP
jgi:hypothetical protein